MKGTRRNYRIICLLTAALIYCWLPAEIRAQQEQPTTDDGRWENGVSEPWWFEPSASKQEVARVQGRWDAIKRENAALLTEPRAGDYATGSEVHGSYLRWAPTAGFVLLHVDKCAARVMGFSYGSVNVTPTTLNLVTERDVRSVSSHGHHESAAQEFLFVTWRGASYLTTKAEIGDFGDLIAGLGKFNDEVEWQLPYYVRLHSKPSGSIDELPTFPPGYERFVKRPIDLKITAVGKRTVRRFKVEYDDKPQYESRTPVVLDGGRAEGVKSGLKFWVVDSGESDQVIVRKVGLHSSRGVIIRWVEEDANTHFTRWKDYDRYPAIKSGWRLTTSVRRLFDLRGPEDSSETTSTGSQNPD